MQANEKHQLVIEVGDPYTGDQDSKLGIIYKATAVEEGEILSGKAYSIVFYDPTTENCDETRDEFPIETLSQDLSNPERLATFVRLIRDAIREEFST
jgi:hypothetical protein